LPTDSGPKISKNSIFTLTTMHTMTRCSGRRCGAFTLIELLVVIAIIALLAGLALPVIAKVRLNAKIKIAKTEMANLASAIKQYEADYNRYPATKDAETAAAGANGDFTYGNLAAPAIGTPPTIKDNRELMYILLNETKRPGAPANVLNRNPKGTIYLNPRMVSGTLRGVSNDDLVYRDPWQNPYIVTMDLNDDGKCLDAFYNNAVVSRNPLTGKGFHGLSENSGKFEFNGPVMIWSLGPDSDANAGIPANQGVNKDNIIGWQ
jgi:prepilin-type N-terminal cleavage/methylation domain-containing protein